MLTSTKSCISYFKSKGCSFSSLVCSAGYTLSTLLVSSVSKSRPSICTLSASVRGVFWENLLPTGELSLSKYYHSHIMSLKPRLSNLGSSGKLKTHQNQLEVNASLCDRIWRTPGEPFEIILLISSYTAFFHWRMLCSFLKYSWFKF